MSHMIPMIDIYGNRVGLVDHSLLEPGVLIHRHNHKLWVLTEGETLEEANPTPIDPEAIFEDDQP